MASLIISTGSIQSWEPLIISWFVAYPTLLLESYISSIAVVLGPLTHNQQHGGWRCCWFILTTTEQSLIHTFLQIRRKCLSYSHDPSDFTLRKSICSRVGLIYERIYPNLFLRKVSLSFTKKPYAGPTLKWQEKLHRCLKWNKKSWETNSVQHIEKRATVLSITVNRKVVSTK